MRHRSEDSRGERGQILVLFVLAIVAIIGMCGLVLDGGSAFAQRRDEQNVSDLASVAGATAYLNAAGDQATKTAAAEAAANAVAAANGYTAGVGGSAIDVTVTVIGEAADVKVDVSKPHRNNFAGVMGMPTWGVSTTATSVSSSKPNAAFGAMPLLFNKAAFPQALCDESKGACEIQTFQLPGTGNQDVPQDETQFNWTIFCTASGNPCNGNSDGVRDIINGNGTDTTIYLDDDIGPLNAGAHTTLFDALENFTGGMFPVPIVDNSGAMVGWAYFRLTGVEGASDKVIKGYFVSPVNGSELSVNNNHADGSLLTGAFTVKLIN